MDLPTAGNTSTLGPVGTTVQALRSPSPSSNIPQRPPIGALLLALSWEPTPTRPQSLHTPSIIADIIAEGASCCLSPPCPSCPLHNPYLPGRPHAPYQKLTTLRSRSKRGQVSIPYRLRRFL